MSRGKYKRKREHHAQRHISVNSLGFSTGLQNLPESNGILTLADLMKRQTMSC